MSNLPGAEEIKQLKSALPTCSHLRAPLVTQTEYPGEGAGLLMLTFSREFVTKPHVISNVDRGKNFFVKDTACTHEGWKCVQLNMHSVA